MAAKTAFFADDGGDPRLNSAVGHSATYVPPHMRILHDPSVTIEEYMHYASLTREEEDERARRDALNTPKVGILRTIIPNKNSEGVRRLGVAAENKESLEKNVNADSSRIVVTDEEWTNASRALRTATWVAVFYLITTDILGPTGLPFAFGTTGWGPGAALYTVFGALAGYSGWLIYNMFMGLDSYQYPLRTYGDLAFRIYGRTARHLMNLLQSVQLICNVGVIIIGNGQALSQVSKFRLCFAICCLVWAIAGFFIGQVRTLQKYGWLANAAIWMNIVGIFITMGGVARFGPNYDAAQTASAGSAISGAGGPLVAQLPDGSYPPVQYSGGLPETGDFTAAVVGLMQAVYAYGGAMIFCEFMSEMKRPRDFLKALSCATLFIYFFYMLFGLFVYGYQGQYTVNPANQGISEYALQTVTNVLNLVSGLIAAGLYGNIGIKVLYNNILMEWFRFPSYTTRNGKFCWAALVPVYWSVAFVIAASIPNFFGLTAVVAAICIMQFTYTFPPLLHLGFAVQKNAMQPGEGFVPETGAVVRHDTGLKRYVRGFFAKYWYINAWHILYFLGAGVTAGLGAYSAIEGLIEVFKSPSVNSFSCHSPLAPS